MLREKKISSRRQVLYENPLDISDFVLQQIKHRSYREIFFGPLIH